MTFIHTPARTTYHPDMFEDPRIDFIYDVYQDEAPEDPRGWIEDKLVALYVFRAPRGRHDEVPDNPIAETFAHFYTKFDEDKALAATRRWLKLFHPEIIDQVDIKISTITGYSQGDWLDVFAVVNKGYGNAVDHINEFRQWAFGDVWTVQGENDSLSGIYADSAEDALKLYIEDNPISYDRLIFDNAVTKAIADALIDRGNEPAARWLHTNEDDLWADPAGLPGIIDGIEARYQAASIADTTT